MKSITIYCFLFIILISNSLSSQEIVSINHIKSWSKAEISAQFFINAQYDVDLYKVTYITKNIALERDTASGVLSIPYDNQAKFPILVYEHGTVGDRHDVPSEGSGEQSVTVAYASNGYHCLAPDYIGLGVSKGLHPYLDPDSEAWATIDMIRAVKTLTPTHDIHFNEQLFITGYSQGGHAAMATCRALQDEEDLVLTAAAPMSGPYNVSRAMKQFTLGDDPYYFCGYLGSVFLTAKFVNPELMAGIEVEDIFKPEYATLIRQFENEQKGLFVINNEMINLLNTNEGVVKPKLMFKDDIRSTIINDNNHPLHQALELMNVDNWTPEAPVKFLYCTSDDQVTYKNAIWTDSLMSANGADNVSSTDVYAAGTHSSCVLPATIQMGNFFSQFQEIGVVGIDVTQNEMFSIYPNPTSNNIQLNITKDNLQNTTVRIVNLDGKIVKEKQLSKEKQEHKISIADLNDGCVIVQIIRDNEVLAYEKLIIIK